MNHTNDPRRPAAHRPADRGVSQLVGFILSFSIIILTVGLLYTTGVGALNDLRGEQQTQNAERVFVAVADGFTELQEGQAPKRAGSLDLDVGATLQVGNASTFNVTVHGPGYSASIATRTLEYKFEQTTIAYESGAVFRDDRGSTGMIGGAPEVYCSNDSRVAVVSLVSLIAPRDPSVSGGTATITGVQQSTTLLYPTDRTGPGVVNVTVNVTSPYEEAWNRYFEGDETDWVPTTGDGRYACEDVSQAFVRHTVIEIRIVS